VYRNYFAPLPSGQIGQTGNEQINNLDELERLLRNDVECYFSVKNGYVKSTTAQLMALNTVLQDIDKKDKLRDAVKVGMQLGVDVVFSGECGGSYEFVAERQQRVSQVFSSALSVASSFGTEPSDWELFARLVLEGIYEATFWAAVVNCQEQEDKQARVHLTFVGGGAFGNRIEWIVDAMNRAITKLDAEGVGIEIHIQHFQKVDPYLEAAIYSGAPKMETHPDWTCPTCTAPVPWMKGSCKWCQTPRMWCQTPNAMDETPEASQSTEAPRCQGGCGFFGSEANSGFCSACVQTCGLTQPNFAQSHSIVRM
jgi:hypothetical protein